MNNHKSLGISESTQGECSEIKRVQRMSMVKQKKERDEPQRQEKIAKRQDRHLDEKQMVPL